MRIVYTIRRYAISAYAIDEIDEEAHVCYFDAAAMPRDIVTCRCCCLLPGSPHYAAMPYAAYTAAATAVTYVLPYAMMLPPRYADACCFYAYC